MKILFKTLAIAAAIGLAPGLAAQAPETGNVASADVAAPAANASATALPVNVNLVASSTSNASTPAPQQLAPTPGIGQPDGRMGIPDQVTPIGDEAAWFHNWILMPAITIISILVLLLMAIVIIRFRRGAHPTPSRTTHNTTLEVVWTLVPVLILVAIAVPSIRLLANQYSPPQADLTLKVTGNQWNWSYEYPDHGVEFTANMLPDEQARARGEPEQLAVDQRVVVPVGAVVKVIVTSSDVIHSWGVPAFWVKMDAVPGRLNETWFRADREGVYYGVCYELCGARHGYMPIAVEVVSRERFAQWIASRRASCRRARPAAATGAPAIGAADSTAATPAPSNVVQAVERPATTNQSAPVN